MDQQVDGPESEHSATTAEPDGTAAPVARRGVRIDAPSVRPWRLVPYCVITVALFFGWLRATGDQNLW
ncbi:hypothetical protein [Frankia sp. QA3]|uniref:hypothetical protein n=1 Tax=Frankia sp. QA3 TaxID=710111 RepID=UPI000269BBE1|nr:hypothetical protein [Frankia sp. QA3]EIV92178.1 hypothetical protein FraQA3DRAFT_1701 [Frankia sp. QA3]